MTVFSFSLTLLIHSHNTPPPPERYTFSPINPLRGRLSERMLEGGNGEQERRRKDFRKGREDSGNKDDFRKEKRQTDVKKKDGGDAFHLPEGSGGGASLFGEKKTKQHLSDCIWLQ